MKTIELNGLLWDAENLSVNGRQHFTYEEAQREAAKLGKRLPTKEEFEELLRLPYAWDTNKKEIRFAEDISDLKNEKSLFLPTAGCRSYDSTTMYNVGKYGYYWSATPNYSTRAYNLFFGSVNVFTYSNNRCEVFAVRCVSDIRKPVIMENNQEIEFKIPEGYVIDDNKSTKTKIVCKPIEPKYPKSFEDAFAGNTISGYEVSSHRVWATDEQNEKDCVKNRFKTEKQALSALAYAQLTQLMALPCYNGDWTPDWNNHSEEKYCIERMRKDISRWTRTTNFCQLAFKSKKVRDEFYHNHMDLIKQFYELWQPVKS